MSKVRSFKWLLGLLVTSNVFAQAQQSPLERVFAACTDFSGQKVQYRPDTNRVPQMAQAGADRKGPFILFSMKHLQSIELDAAIWVLRHECGHHALGHFSAKNSGTSPRQMEFEADCFAAKEARRLGLDLSQIVKEVSRFSEDAAHPAPLARIELIQRCYHSAQ